MVRTQQEKRKNCCTKETLEITKHLLYIISFFFFFF